jgi:hypothetical protein
MQRPILTFDIEGQDTAHKLAILTSLAYGTQVAADEIYVEGITNISLSDIHAARELGYRIKLLGVALRTATGIEQRCIPTMVPLGSMIGQVDSVTNAVDHRSRYGRFAAAVRAGRGRRRHRISRDRRCCRYRQDRCRATRRLRRSAARPTSLEPYTRARNLDP